MRQRKKVLAAHLPVEGRRHPLPGELIVSLTSYPPRFSTLHLTLRSLLLQTVKPNRLILWIAHNDLPKLPEEVRALANFGLEIRACEDLRSYKKLIPALRAFPNAFIVTADDDLYYPPDWLSVLVTGFDPSQPMIISRRAVRVKRARSGSPLPFKEWEQDVQDAQAREPSRDLMPETGGGALFPPGCFHPIVEDRKRFERLAPTGDDLWFYWCARMADTLVKKVGDRLIVSGWPGSRASALWNDNEAGGNDRMISALDEEFGARVYQLDPPRVLEHIFVGGVKVALLSRAELTRHIVDDSLRRRAERAGGPPTLLFDSNGQGISLAATDPEYRKALEQADVVHADGGFVVLASRFVAGAPVPDRSATTDLLHDVAAAGLPHGLSHYLLGATEEVNAACAKRLREIYPGIVIAGRGNGYFTAAEEAGVIAAIEEAAPDILWVGLGKPREQLFAANRREALRASWLITCGGCFNYVTGHYRRAPEWMQRINLEWLFRAVTTPKLLWRYATTSPHAIWLVATRVDRRRG